MQDCDVQNINNNTVTVAYSGGSVSPYVGPQVPAVPVLSSPSNGATAVTTSPNLIWQSSTGAESYTVLVASDAAFSNVVFTKSNITGTTTNCKHKFSRLYKILLES